MNRYEKILKYVHEDISGNPPYFKPMETYGLKPHEKLSILTTYLGPISHIVEEYTVTYVVDKKGDRIYMEKANGWWKLTKYKRSKVIEVIRSKEFVLGDCDF